MLICGRNLTSPRPRRKRCGSNALPSDAAFTLIELMIAVAISAVLIAAIGSVLFVTLRMRDSSMRATGQTAPVDRAISIMKHDLECVVPVGKLAGAMGTDASGNGLTTTPLLEVFTGSGLVSADEPWGDVQKIDYALQAPTNRGNFAGRNLVRSVTRNLLASGTVLPEPQALLEDVSTLQFSFYDGTNWNDTWSTSLSNIPVAIRVNIELADDHGARSVQSPIKFLVPVVTWSNTNSITNQVSN